MTSPEAVRLGRLLIAVRQDLERRGYQAAGVLGQAARALLDLARERDELAAELRAVRGGDRAAPLCACGCGFPVRKPARGPTPRWYSEAHRKRSARVRGSSGVVRSPRS